MSLAGPLAVIVAIVAQSAATPEPPRGVNSSIIGTAEEFAVSGPARVCLMHTSIDLDTGETAYLDYLGLHHGGFRVTGPDGTFHILEGNAWAEPHGGERVPDARERRVERHRREEAIRYLIYGPSIDDPDLERPLVWVDGDAIGRSHDLAILARINVRQDDLDSCDRSYFYGFEGWGQVSRSRRDQATAR